MGVVAFPSIAVLVYAFLVRTGSGLLLIQGRYLAPVVLLLLLSMYGIRFAPRRLGTPFVVAVPLVMMFGSLQTLMSVYHP